jgi:hypothetical protein
MLHILENVSNQVNTTSFSDKEEVSWSTKMEEYMKENGIMILGMEEDLNGILMETFT